MEHHPFHIGNITHYWPRSIANQGQRVSLPATGEFEFEHTWCHWFQWYFTVSRLCSKKHHQWHKYVYIIYIYIYHSIYIHDKYYITLYILLDMCRYIYIYIHIYICTYYHIDITRYKYEYIYMYMYMYNSILVYIVSHILHYVYIVYVIAYMYVTLCVI